MEGYIFGTVCQFANIIASYHSKPLLCTVYTMFTHIIALQVVYRKKSIKALYVFLHWDYSLLLFLTKIHIYLYHIVRKFWGLRFSRISRFFWALKLLSSNFLLKVKNWGMVYILPSQFNNYILRHFHTIWK